MTIDGTIELNRPAIKELGITAQEQETIIQQTYEKLKQRKQRIYKNRPFPHLLLKTALLVDDGLSSGYTMMAAVRSVKKQTPKEIIVAVATASVNAANLVHQEVKDVISLYLHPRGVAFSIAVV